MRREIVFVHVPKTAGTSLRIALQRAATNHRILRDYEGHDISSPELAPVLGGDGQVRGFREHFSDASPILLAGHFPASRYWPFFNAESFITFVRNPVDRVLSSYAAWVKSGRWTGSLEDFVALPSMGKRLVSFLGGVEIGAFGFIGFMEEYEASIRALSEYAGMELQVLVRNRGNYDAVGAEIMADEARRALVAKNAAADIRLYERLRARRSGRYRAPGADGAIAATYIGEASREGDAITGWLCNTAREFIAGVEIWRGTERIAKLKADLYVAKAKERGHSRSGVCGFRASLAELGKGAKLQSGDALAFRAEGGAYELQGSPILL